MSRPYCAVTLGVVALGLLAATATPADANPRRWGGQPPVRRAYPPPRPYYPPAYAPPIYYPPSPYYGTYYWGATYPPSYYGGYAYPRAYPANPYRPGWSGWNYYYSAPRFYYWYRVN